MNIYLMFCCDGLHEIAVIRTIARLATPPTPTAVIIATEVERQRKQFLDCASLRAEVEEISSPAGSHAVEVYIDSSYIVSLPVRSSRRSW